MRVAAPPPPDRPTGRPLRAVPDASGDARRPAAHLPAPGTSDTHRRQYGTALARYHSYTGGQSHERQDLHARRGQPDVAPRLPDRRRHRGHVREGPPGTSGARGRQGRRCGTRRDPWAKRHRERDGGRPRRRGGRPSTASRASSRRSRRSAARSRTTSAAWSTSTERSTARSSTSAGSGVRSRIAHWHAPRRGLAGPAPDRGPARGLAASPPG